MLDFLFLFWQLVIVLWSLAHWLVVMVWCKIFGNPLVLGLNRTILDTWHYISRASCLFTVIVLLFYILLSDSGTFIFLTGWEVNPMQTESLQTPFRWKANQFRRRVTAVVSNTVCMSLPISNLDSSLWWMCLCTCPSYGKVHCANIWRKNFIYRICNQIRFAYISCCCTATWCSFAWAGTNILVLYCQCVMTWMCYDLGKNRIGDTSRGLKSYFSLAISWQPFGRIVCEIMKTSDQFA